MDNDKLDAALERLEEMGMGDPHAAAMAAGLDVTEKALEIGGPVRNCTDQEVLAAMRSDAALNRVRRVFAAWSAKIEQAQAQRRPPTPIEVRRMEFEAAEDLIREARR